MTPLATQSFAPGQIIAEKYELVRLIGEGGMGAVYEARHTTTHKRCAAKVLLNPELVRTQEVIHRFFREARASSMVESDHIVQVFDSGFDPATGCPYMILEFLDGEDLDETIQRLGAINPDASAKLVLQAAIGLARAHEQGIVHRDIKPANLYLCHRENDALRVKLLDFGIAKVIDGLVQTEGDSHGLTRTGSMLGTPLYMSPEQAKGASRVDAQADVWSLGVALYQFLSGRLPYDLPESLGELMVAIITKELIPLQDVAPWVSPELAEVTERAISRDLGKRYRNAGELRDALSALFPDGPELTQAELFSVPEEERARVAPRLDQTRGGAPAATSAGLAFSQPQATKAAGRGTTAWFVGALVVLTAGLAGGLLWMRNSQAADLAAENAPGSSGTAPTQLVFSLKVAPANAEVLVEDKPTVVKSGSVDIEGPVGATRKVTLKVGERSIDQVVAIANAGLVPNEVTLPEPAAPSASSAASAAPAAATLPTKPVAAQPQTKATSKAPKSEPAAPPPKPKGPQLSSDTSEFQ
ncbi:MAG: serine/threonine protein kinase [Polyangiaceae bacterium]